MKGIILAGGAGSRLHPITQVITKQLLPIYDKPMIYYPLSLLMMTGIREVLIITTEKDNEHFKSVLGDGSQLGIKIEYATQKEPKGIAEAYVIGEEFLDNQDSIMILGDNLFHGNFQCFRDAVKKQMTRTQKNMAQIFAYPVRDPNRYGVVEFDKKTKKVISIEEKPQNPKSNYAIPGLYILDNTASQRAKDLAPSHRGELEITDLNRTYLDEGNMQVQLINRGMAWLDTGTPQSYLEANSYVAAIEQRQGFKIACLEEVALRMEFIDSSEFEKIIDSTPNSPYKDYLIETIKDFRTQE